MRHTLRGALMALFSLSLALPAVASASFKVMGTLTRETNLAPGQRAMGRIMVQNTGGELIELEAYETDYHFTAEGVNSYDKPGTLPRSSGDWVEISPRQLRIPPGETLSFHYTLAVPEDPSLTGSYWSMVMIAPIPQTAEAGAAPGDGQIAVSTTMRYGIQMVTEVGPSAKGSIRVESAKLTQAEGKTALNLTLFNDGLRHVRPDLWVEVYDEEGVSRGRFPGERKRIYPTCSTLVSVDLSALPKGAYHALMVADLGRDEVVGARYELDIP